MPTARPARNRAIAVQKHPSGSYGQVVENPVKPRGVRPRHRSPIRWPSQAMGLKWLAPVQPPLIPPLLHASNQTLRPFQATMAGDVERQFQPAPDSEFVERVPQIILYYLLRR